MGDKDVSQAMRPHGILGRIFAVLMEWMNSGAYHWVVSRLRYAKPQSLFEIGFGTGGFLELAVRRLSSRMVFGVDPSSLMLVQARGRLKKFGRQVVADLREGDDSSVFWPTQKFDAIVALHSFQFWSDPASTLARLRGELSDGGRLVLVLRLHGSKAPAWLPNPISRSGDEVNGTKRVLVAAGFRVVVDEKVGASWGLVCEQAQ